MPEQLFSADQVSRALSLSPSGLRKLSVEVSAYLSEHAQGRAGGTGRAQRRYSEADLELLRTVRQWTAAGATYPEARRRLSEIRPPRGGTVEPQPAPPRAETTPEPPPPVGTSETALALDSMRLAHAALRRLVDSQDTVIEMQRREIERLTRELDQVRAAPPPAPSTGESAPPSAPPAAPSTGEPRGEALSTLPAPGEQPPEPPAGETVEPSTWWDKLRRALLG